MLSEIEKSIHVQIIAGEVIDLMIESNTIGGVVLADGSQVTAGAVVITTGTFLRGKIHIGDVSQDGGRAGSAWSNERAAGSARRKDLCDRG